MRVQVDASRKVLAVFDRLDDITTAAHKYAVIDDRRRKDPGWGSHADALDLSKLTVRHQRSTEFLNGRLVAYRDEPADRVTDYLVSQGVTVLDDVDDDGDAKVIA
jgi:hypothetical protein